MKKGVILAPIIMDHFRNKKKLYIFLRKPFYLFFALNFKFSCQVKSLFIFDVLTSFFTQFQFFVFQSNQKFVYFRRLDKYFSSRLNFNFSRQIKSLFIFDVLTSFFFQGSQWNRQPGWSCEVGQAGQQTIKCETSKSRLGQRNGHRRREGQVLYCGRSPFRANPGDRSWHVMAVSCSNGRHWHSSTTSVRNRRAIEYRMSKHCLGWRIWGRWRPWRLVLLYRVRWSRFVGK